MNDVRRGRPLRFSVNGQEVEAYEGETVAAALLAADQVVLRRTVRRDEPRGFFCGMGVCFDCLVSIDGRPNQQACLTPVIDGMQVELQDESAIRNRQS
jgi:predicted molibdopterin-dependent oxidoreductase YjgC